MGRMPNGSDHGAGIVAVVGQTQCDFVDPGGLHARCGAAMQAQRASARLGLDDFDVAPIDSGIGQIKRFLGGFLGGKARREPLGHQCTRRGGVTRFLRAEQAPNEAVAEH